MKLAVLGSDSEMLPLIAAAQAAGHEFTWIGDVRDDDAAAIARLLPALPVSRDWESLLDHRLADAVLVGRGQTSDTLRAEQLKRLAADIMPVLAIHPASASVLTYYELDMARHEVHGVLRHYSPLVGTPATAILSDWIHTGSGPIGTVHQVICQRYLSDCSRDSVLRNLARDVEVLREVAGTIRKVSAVGPQVADASYASLQVQMSTPGTATLRWAVVPTNETAPRATLQLIGEHGTATLELAPHGELVMETNGGRQVVALPSHDAPQQAIDALAKAVTANGTEASEAASTWSAATIAMEIADTIELSLQKGRTIEVHQQRLTEQLAFRGTMAAFGCGLLLFALFALVLAGVVGDVLGLPLRGYWPLAMLAVLAIFLAMQLLPWLVKRPKAATAASDPHKH